MRLVGGLAIYILMGLAWGLASLTWGLAFKFNIRLNIHV